MSESGGMKPINTVYGGYRFRSRLEARWAVFFDALGLAYDYEKEGFELDGDRYLPDFWLPDLECWIEVKADFPDERSRRVAAKLRDASGYPVVILAGKIGGHLNLCFANDMADSAGGPSEWAVMWAVCRMCSQPTLSWGDERHAIVGPDWLSIKGNICRTPADAPGEWFTRCDFEAPRIAAAYDAANQARFEYGESGAPAEFTPIYRLDRYKRGAD